MRPRTCFRTDHRSLSVTVNYILALGISAILVTGLLIAGGAFVEDQREQVIEGELSVIGHHIAGNVEQVDRLVTAADDNPDAAYINQSFQRSVTGATYNIEVAEDPDRIILSTSHPDVQVEVNATVNNDLDYDAAAGGGTVSAYWDGDELVIDNA